VEEVLVEGRSKQRDRDMTGRTRSNKVVNFEGDLNLIGELIPIRTVKAYAHSLRGEIVPTHCGLQNADCGMKSQNSPV
jgi:tRNA-2-methylthio-N6-dimethylallyladenosine synthase